MTDAELRAGNTAGDAADGTHVGGGGIGGAMTVIAYRVVVVVGDNVSVVVRTSYEDSEKVEIGSDVGAIAEAAADGRRPVVIAHDATVGLFVYTVTQHELGSYGAVGDGADVGAITGAYSILGSDTSAILAGDIVRRERDGTFHMAVGDGTLVFTGDACHPFVSSETTAGHGEIADGTPCSQISEGGGKVVATLIHADVSDGVPLAVEMYVAGAGRCVVGILTETPESSPAEVNVVS